MNRIAAAILAAGTSSRLGTPKQLLDLGGKPVLAHTLDAVRRSSLEPVLVVLGHERDRVMREVDLTGAMVIDNPEFATGQSSSVRAAIGALPEDVDAVVFVLSDQPLVDPDVIDRLAAARRSDHATIAQPRYAEGRGNPVLLGRELFGELMELTGDTGARPLLERRKNQVVVVEVSDHHRPDDVDTIEDYERLKETFAARQKQVQ